VLPAPDKIKVAVVGLGYVGLPLAVYLSSHFPMTGFDVDRTRIEQLRQGVDRTRELSADELNASHRINFTDASSTLGDCNFIIVTVTTPIDQAKRPDLSALIAASRTIGAALRAAVWWFMNRRFIPA
jgi:UDP-N-acetyl-D-galactosamine dehydrogenase